MRDTEWRAEVRRNARRLLATNLDPGTQRAAAVSLFELLAAPIGLDDRDPDVDDARESVGTAGKAISPLDAARCLRDFARTAKFLRATRDAINAVSRTVDHEPVRVLYAGCGPFATLALPIAHEWAPGTVSFTLLDCHGRSLEAARELASRLGVLDRIEAFVETDASTYQCRPEGRPHVVVTETMQRGLASEPQVAITRQLGPQLRAGGILVPERVTLHATLLDPGREFAFDSAPLKRRRLELGCVMTLDKEGARLAPVVWPAEPPAGMEPFIRTNIRVRSGIHLGDYESGLTGLTPMPLERLPEPGEEIGFAYEPGPNPRLVSTLGRRTR